MLETRPVVTKMVTGGVLFCVGDALAQYLDGTLKEKGFQVDRMVRGVIWGGVLFSPGVIRLAALFCADSNPFLAQPLTCGTIRS